MQWIWSMYISVALLLYVLSFFFFFFGYVSKMSLLMYLFDLNLSSWSSVDMSYEMLFDWLSSVFMGVVFLISGSVVLYSKEYSGGGQSEKRFMMLVVMFILSMLFMVTSGGLLSMMLGWDSLGVVSYVLVIYYQSESSYKSGIITIMTNRVGDVLIIISLSVLMMIGMWSYKMIEGGLVGVLLIVAACTKSAQIPFSAWLPEAMAAPTPVSSLVHSSTLVTAGVFMSIRLEHLLGEEGVGGKLLMSMSLLTMIVAGFSALLEMDGKKIVASSTLSQLGLMMFSLSNGLWKLAYSHMIMHAFFKALMFMSVGSILWAENGNQDCRFMSGKFSSSFMVNQGLMISVMCLMGCPFFCSFFSKDLMLEVYFVMEGGIIEEIFFLVGFSLSVFYGSRLLGSLSVSMGSEKSFSGFLEKKYMNFGIFFLMLFSLFGGVIFSWLEDSFADVSISSKDKISGLIFLLSGVLWSGWVNGKIFVKVKTGAAGFMAGSWNFKILTGVLSNKLMMWFGDYASEDTSWVEEFGGGGFYSGSGGFISDYMFKVVNFFFLLLFFLTMVFSLI